MLPRRSSGKTDPLERNPLAAWAGLGAGGQLGPGPSVLCMAVLTSRLAASPALLTSSATLMPSRKLQLENLRST
jgi:hypothetical protein